MALQSVARAASLGQLSRVTASAVPGPCTLMTPALPAAGAPLVVQAPGKALQCSVCFGLTELNQSISPSLRLQQDSSVTS